MKEIKLQDILENTSEIKEKKVGYVAIIGRPNAWKSTFLNTLIGEKISITSKVPQTTRNKILWIYNSEDSQIIFFDTPGIHESEKVFNQEINNQAISSLKDANVILYFIDSTRPRGQEEKYIEGLLQWIETPILKVYTKSDLPSNTLTDSNDNVYNISSITKDGFWELLSQIKSLLPLWPTFFPEDFYTKQSIYFRISEVIREKVFLHTKQELPHSVFVAIEEIDDQEELLRIVAYIYTETESQKYIVVWNKGSLISQIGKEARLDLEKIFEKKIFLALRAKSKKWWRKDEKFLRKSIFF